MNGVIDVGRDPLIVPVLADAPPNQPVRAACDQAADDARWNEWKMKGRYDEARFRRRLRTVIVDVAAVAAVAAAGWLVFRMSV